MSYNRLGRFGITALLVVISLLWLYPFVWPIFSSFKTSAEMFRAGYQLWPEHWIVQNYINAWTKAQFSRYLFNSVTYSVFSTLLSVSASALAGYTLARYRFPGSRFLQILILAMLFLPTATSILPVFDLIQNIGLLDTPFGVILALSGGVGFATILFQGYFKNMPQELYDAAMMDGANFPQQFMLFLPLARPIIATTIILGFNSAWQEYFIPLVFTLGKPELRTLSVGLRAFIGQYSVDISGFAAAETISMIPIIIVFLIFQRQFVNGLTGAVKG